jgi:hypothetical protein
MTRSASQQLPDDAQAIRYRVAAALRMHVDWQSLQLWPYFDTVHNETFVLPAWLHPFDPLMLTRAPNVNKQLREVVVDATVQQALEDEHMQTSQFGNSALPGTSQFVPYKTLGNGDCLSHAMSCAIWGVSDRASLLRHLMQLLVAPGNSASVRIRTAITAEHQRVAQASCVALRRSSHAECTDQQCVWYPGFTDDEWSSQVFQRGAPALSYPAESHLTANHIYLMTLILRRPVVVQGGENVTQTFWPRDGGLPRDEVLPNSTRGVYFPNVLPAPLQQGIVRTPIFVHFSGSHYTALCPLDKCDQDPQRLCFPIDMSPLVWRGALIGYDPSPATRMNARFGTELELGQFLADGALVLESVTVREWLRVEGINLLTRRVPRAVVQLPPPVVSVECRQMWATLLTRFEAHALASAARAGGGNDLDEVAEYIFTITKDQVMFALVRDGCADSMYTAVTVFIPAVAQVRNALQS